MFMKRQIISTPIFYVGLCIEYIGHLLGMLTCMIDYGVDEGLETYWRHLTLAANKRWMSCKKRISEKEV